MKGIFILGTLLMCLQPFTQAQKAGDLDSSFGTNGIAKIQFKAGNLGEESGIQLLAQPNGQMIAVAQLEGKFILGRFNADGSVDETYGIKGRSEPLDINNTSDDNIFSFYAAAAMQPNGKVLIAWNEEDIISGTFTSLLARFNTNGTRDNDFGTVSLSEPNTFQTAILTVQPDGKILAGGYAYANGDIGEPYFVVGRYNQNGTPDAGFGTGGSVTADEAGFLKKASTVVLQTDGKIVALGSSFGDNNSFIARYKSNGDPDPAFNQDGIADIDFNASALVILHNKQMVVTGIDNTSHLALRRFNANGSKDTSFSGDGKKIYKTIVPEISTLTIAVQTNARLLVSVASDSTGQSEFNLNLYRFYSSGTPDPTFASNGKLAPDFSNVRGFLRLPGNKVMITGSTHNGLNKDLVLARYDSNGAPDPTLGGDGVATVFYSVGYSSFISTTLQKDGKPLALGQSFNGQNFDKLLTRYTGAGTLDNSFENDGIKPVDSSLQTVAIQASGKIIVSGGLIPANNHTPLIARYQLDGSLDPSFGNAGIIQHNISSIVAAVMQKDGKILIAGNRLTSGDYDFAITRYNSNGTLDHSFSQNGWVTTDFGSPADFVKAVAIQEDGKIIVSGTAFGQSVFDFNTTLALARYNSNGSLDNNFGQAGKTTPNINSASDVFLAGNQSPKGSLAIQPDGKILIAAEGWTELLHATSPVFHGLLRLNKNGSVDDSFGEQGNIDFRLGANPKLLMNPGGDGRIILSAGSILRRLHPDGTQDPSLPENDKRLTQINDILIDNNRLYVAGSIDSFANSYAVIAAVLLNISQPLAVKITAPANNSTFAAPATFFVTATVSNPDGAISKVEFYNGTQLLFTEFAAPYHHQLSHMAAGTYRLTAKAYDKSGKTAASSVITVIVTDGSLRMTTALLKARLEQNVPNPARGTTLIRYYMPVKSSSARLVVTNLKGQIVQQFSLSDSGPGQVSINTANLSAGAYSYILYVDNNLVDSRLMIVAK